VDGRFPHWVAPYDPASERYSLIFYQTEGVPTLRTTAVFPFPHTADNPPPSTDAATKAAPDAAATDAAVVHDGVLGPRLPMSCFVKEHSIGKSFRAKEPE